MNDEEFDGGLVRGVKGITDKSDSSTKANAIENAIRVAKTAVDTDVNKKIAKSLEASSEHSD